jgi:predicted nuclease with TOPRIM domain
MNIDELALKQQQTEDRSLRNEGRIKKLEEKNEALSSLATSVAVLAEQMKTMNVNVNSLTSKVEEIEAKPAKRWEAVVAAVISALAAGVIGFVTRGML